MLPKFPEFKSLELTDRADVEEITRNFPPYSDFNFTSMWSWDVHGQMKISNLNGNLVVRFTDYLNNEPFYSFLGNNLVNETAEVLLDLSEKEKSKVQLQLVPEDSIKSMDASKFEIEEDQDHFDYVYSIEELTKLSGAKHSNSRRLVNNLLRKNKKVFVKTLDLTLEKNRTKILQLNDSWKMNKELDFDNENEKGAILKLLDSAKYLSILNVGIFVEDELIAFTMNEELNNGYALSFFAKFDTKYRGCYLYSMKETSDILLKKKYKYMNCEQDLGLPGLRFSKQALSPAFYLKKYKVSNRGSSVI
jgi:hypothetical protein